MDPTRQPHREMTDPGNRNVLATVNMKFIACAQRSMARAIELEIPEKQERILDCVMMTAGLEGRAREDLRDALAGARAPPVALGSAPAPRNDHGGVPHL